MPSLQNQKRGRYGDLWGPRHSYSTHKIQQPWTALTAGGERGTIHIAGRDGSRTAALDSVVVCLGTKHTLLGDITFPGIYVQSKTAYSMVLVGCLVNLLQSRIIFEEKPQLGKCLRQIDLWTRLWDSLDSWLVWKGSATSPGQVVLGCLRSQARKWCSSVTSASSPCLKILS